MDNIRILSLSKILGDNKEIEQIEEPIQMFMTKEQIDNMKKNAINALIEMTKNTEQQTSEVKKIQSVQPLHIYEIDEDDNMLETENKGKSR